MLRTMVLDNTGLSKIVSPEHKNHEECLKRLRGLLEGGNETAIPEAADRESRRGLPHKNMKEGLEGPDCVCGLVTFAPIATDAVKNAAEFRAEARKKG